VSDDNKVSRKGPPSSGDQLRRESLGAPGTGEHANRERGAFHPVTRGDVAPTPGESPAFRRIPNGSTSRRGPSYPAWEKPPTPYDFPRLYTGKRGRSIRVTWPVLFAGLCVVLVVVCVAALFVLRGHGGGIAAASPSSTATFDVGSSSAVSTPFVFGGAATPTPVATPVDATQWPSSRQYTVVSGDTVSRIATKFGLKTWEVLVANQNLAHNPNALRIGLVITIPWPGQMVPPTPAPSITP